MRGRREAGSATPPAVTRAAGASGPCLADAHFGSRQGRALKPGDIHPGPPPRACGLAGGAPPCRRRAVARVDRCSSPPALSDLLAAARFAAQPLDDLSWRPPGFALVRLEPDELFEAAHGRDGALWPHLRRRSRRRGSRSPRHPRHGRLRRRTCSSRRSCRGRSTAGGACSAGSARRRATRSRNCCRARLPSRARPPPRCRASLTGSPAATSRSSATLPRRSTRCG